MKLLIATQNRHKVEEIRAIFYQTRVQLLDMSSFPALPEVEETGLTFAENAILKAVSAATHAHMWAMADDSGLEVQVLKGKPGIMSARYAGEPVNYAANNAKLLKELAGTANRAARFCCAIALSDRSGSTEVAIGYCHGSISVEERGENGFGYDPLFIPEGCSKTFAEMSADEKNRISHRSRALKLAQRMWSDLFANAATQ